MMKLQHTEHGFVKDKGLWKMKYYLLRFSQPLLAFRDALRLWAPYGICDDLRLKWCDISQRLFPKIVSLL